MFTGKTLMITGGTGSFGNAVLRRFLETDVGEIRVFSRDEEKQDAMRHTYQTLFPQASEKIKFYRRCAGHSVHSRRFARRGLYFPCRRVKASAFLRIFPH